MRSPALLLSIALLAGCENQPGTHWRDLQRQRIASLHLPQVTAAETVARVRDAAPRPSQQQPQEPRETLHLDQRLPPVNDAGPFVMHRPWQPLQVSLDVGVGHASTNVAEARLDDHATILSSRLRLDAGDGTALHVETWRSDDDLFAGRLVDDGTSLEPADGRFSGLDLFPHVRRDEAIGALCLPMRIGLFTDWQRITHDTAGIERTWLAFGPRLVAEPTLRLLHDDRVDVDLVGRLGADVGAAWFQERHRDGGDGDSTFRWAGELGVGVRAAIGSLHAEIGYRLTDTNYGPLSGDLYGDRHHTALRRQQLFFTVGLTF